MANDADGYYVNRDQLEKHINERVGKYGGWTFDQIFDLNDASSTVENAVDEACAVIDMQARIQVQGLDSRNN